MGEGVGKVGSDEGDAEVLVQLADATMRACSCERRQVRFEQEEEALATCLR